MSRDFEDSNSSGPRSPDQRYGINHLIKIFIIKIRKILEMFVLFWLHDSSTKHFDVEIQGYYGYF